MEEGALGVDAALLFDDADPKMAAAIWDQIVRIEKDNMYDSEVMRTAIKFKKEHLARQTSEQLLHHELPVPGVRCGGER